MLYKAPVEEQEGRLTSTPRRLHSSDNSSKITYLSTHNVPATAQVFRPLFTQPELQFQCPESTSTA